MPRPKSKLSQRLNGKLAIVKRTGDWPRRCAVRFCRLTVRIVEKSKFCARHNSQVFKERSPLKYHYNLLKSGSKRRGIPVTLTYQEYEQFCINTGLHENRGKNATSLTIDRKNSKLGYSLDNIRVKTMTMNSRLAHVPYFRQLILEEEERQKQERREELEPW